MPTKLLVRIGEGLNDIEWDDFDVDEYVEPPTLLERDQFHTNINSLFVDGNSTSYKNVTSFTRSTEAPSSDITTVEIQDTTTDSPIKIYTWLNEDNSVSYYCQSNTIYLPEYSYGLFDNFTSCTSIDTTGWDTSKVTNMSLIFYNCPVLQSIDVSNFDTSNIGSMQNMFYGDESLTEIIGMSKLVKGASNIGNLFKDCALLTTLDVSEWDTSNVSQCFGMFDGLTNLTSIVGNISNLVTSKVTNLERMFRNTSSNVSDTKALEVLKNKLQSEMANWDTSNVIRMNNMFYNCNIFDEINLSTFNTSKLIYAKNMFSYNDKIETINGLSITSTTKDISYMFKNTSNLKTISGISNWDTSGVTNMGHTFSNADSIESLDVSNWNVSKVTNMANTFGCESLKTLNISNWDTSSVTNMGSIFSGSSSLTELQLGTWNTSNVKYMYGVFDGCDSLNKVDISGWDTNKVTNMASMFRDCTNLKYIKVPDEGFDLSSVTNLSFMFNDTHPSLFTTTLKSDSDDYVGNISFRIFKKYTNPNNLDQSGNIIDVGSPDNPVRSYVLS